jgi:hypothetical protein
MRFDLPVLVAGAAVTAGLSVTFAVLLLWQARSGEAPDVGPTAASLDEGLSILFGAALGLLVGAALTAAVARRGPRIVTGVLAGIVAYGFVLVPILVATRPSDIGIGESLSVALTVAVPMGFTILIGSMAGSAAGSVPFLVHRFRSRET